MKLSTSGPSRVSRKARRTRRVTSAFAGMLVVALVSAACGGGGDDEGGTGTDGGGGGGDATAPANLTLWAWTPKAQTEVDLFEKAHPEIKVKLVNAGQGTPQYTKLRTALKAGSGAPDVVQIEFQYIPTFSITEDLVDLNEYGADEIKDQFPEWVWSLVAPDGDAAYGIPWDTGPLGFMYREDLLKKAKVEVPTTWDEFREAAQKYRAANPDSYLIDLAPTQGGQLLALMAQAGSRPFKVTGGDTVNIKVNDEGAKKWAALWTEINNDDSLARDPDFNDAWYKGLSNGRYAGWLAAAWGPVFLQGTAANTSGKWRVAELPQWTEGEHVTANWGGSTLAVTAQSKFPAQAAELAKWLMTDEESALLFSTKQFLFPSKTSILENPEYADQEVEFFGGQKVNSLYAGFSDNIEKDYTWSPFQDYVYQQMNETLGKAIVAKGDLSAALDDLQAKLVSYGKAQGFNVTEE